MTTKLSAIEAQIADLQAQAAEIRARGRADALSQARALVKQYSLTAHELGLSGSATTATTVRRAKSADPLQRVGKRTAVLRLIAQTLIQQGPTRS